jgi:uncharacterized membrane protein
MKQWWVILLAALAGVTFTSVQIVERIATLRNPDLSLACDINAVMSCSNVLEAWQSSVIFGIPNALLGTIMFTILGTSAAAVLLGTVPTRAFLRGLWGLALFFAAFATWFMMQTAFVIGALCLWCIGITTAIGLIGATLTHIAGIRGDLGGVGRTITYSGLAWFIWAGWWVAVAGLLAVGLIR